MTATTPRMFDSQDTPGPGHRINVRSRRDTPEPGRPVATFRVPYLAFLDSSGKPLGKLPDFAESAEIMLPMYRAMALTRAFDAKAVKLQRTGRLGTYPSSLGQEAVGVGMAAVMAEKDVLLTTYREQGAHLWRGVTMTEILQYWGGDERGSAFANQPRDFPISVPIGTHAPHAVGVAAAMKLRRDRCVAVCALGDGATSKGDFYEALNLAGAWRLPVVFVVNNNQWAISVSRKAQTAAETLAQKAIAAGFEGVQVDGNDLVAVRHAVGRAVERARDGEGPGLVEAVTYRLSDHTTADDARRYRPDDEVSAQWARDPLARVRSFISGRGWWSKRDEEALISDCRASVEDAVDAFLAVPPEPPTAMFDHLYAKLPEPLRRQRAEVAGGDADA